MQKDFETWNQTKIQIDASSKNVPYFKEGEVWWICIGLNVGVEINGKGETFTRPAVIVKKYNKYSFLSIPLTTSRKYSTYLFSVGVVGGKQAFAALSQIRIVDTKRLIKKIGTLDINTFRDLKTKTSRINFD